MSGENVTEPRVGQVLAGKYRVDKVLGVGGMGVVVACHHLGLDTPVAIKLLLPEMLAHEDVVARFAREARAAARLQSEHVTRVFDVGSLENGAPYLVMEFLNGLDLRQWLEQHGPLPVTQAVDFMLQVCEAIGEAHRLGIVHRDLKPANLFCVRRAEGSLCVKVLDFGISKMTAGPGGSSNMSMTRTAALMGTPFYMSPEQLESARDVDGRADIWALGVILHELLTGKVPFNGETLPEVCIKIATHAPPPIRQIRRDVPEAVEAAILQCLARDRTKRFASAADLAAVLAPFGSVPSLNMSRDRAQAVRMPTMVAGQATAAAALADLAPQTGRTPWGESLGAVGNTQIGARGRNRVMGIAVAAGAVVVAALGIAVFVATRPAAVGPAESPVQGAGAQAAAPPQPQPAETHAAALAPPPPAVVLDAPDAGPSAALVAPPAEVAASPHAAAPAAARPERPRAPEAARPQAPKPPPPARPGPQPAHPPAEPAGGSAFDERL